MDTRALDAAVNAHFRAEASGDVDAVLGTLTEDVRHHVVGATFGPLVGRAAVRPFYEQVIADTKPSGVTPLHRWYGDGFVVDEMEWAGWLADGRLFGAPGRSGRVTFRMLHVFEVRDGLISVETVYADHAAIAAQLGGQS
ncbi:MAG TPA: nuclear transport factor 2 family protein [Frankiaceae bacterium]|nr:nuclear transport factor 2 family protein [Frankiaceae bacterium]